MPATSIVKGQNAPLPPGPVQITVAMGAPSDLSALLVTANGKVRSDADFVFFNQPDGPGVRCSQPAAGQPWRIDVNPAAVPAEIDQVRIVVNLEDPAGRFGTLPPPVATVADVGGNPLINYQATGLDTESIVIVAELYRRGADWKVRAVGQGYAGGLADLIRDHGVSVDDDGGHSAPQPPAAAPAPAAPPPPGPGYQQVPPPSPSSFAQPAPGQFPTGGQGQFPPATPGQFPPAGPGQFPSGPQPQFPAPPQDPYPATTQPQYPQPAPGQLPPPANPAQFQPPTPAPGYQQAPAAQHQQPGPYQQPPAPQPAAGQPGEVSLVKGRSVSLAKGQRVSLRKEDGGGLTLVRMGLGWDPVKKRGLFGSREIEIDLDASAVMFADNQGVDIVFYNNLSSKDGSVQHAGDNRTGAGDGDDETIMIDLTRIPAHVTTVMLIVTSYEGQTFEQVENAFCRLVDHTNGQELARYTMAGGMPFTGLVAAKLFREGGGWKLLAIGEGIQGRTPLDALPALARFL